MLATVPRLMRRAGALTLIALVVGVVAGCGGSGVVDATSAAGQPAAQTPSAAVLELWDAIATGNPTLPNSYDRRVVDLVGADNLFYLFRGNAALFGTEPQVRSVTQTPQGTVVVIRVKPKGSSAVTGSYVLRKRGSRWVVLFDSTLTDIVGQQLAIQAQERVNPRKNPGRGARAAGRRAERQLREVVGLTATSRGQLRLNTQ
jgi:hypothetical protein